MICGVQNGATVVNLRTLTLGLPVINPTMLHTHSKFSASAIDLIDATVHSHPTPVPKNKPGV
jgi:hypothetical protein